MKLNDIHIRDPFIVYYNDKYYMYGTRGKGCWDTCSGFDVYISEELYQKYHNYLEKTSLRLFNEEEEVNNNCEHRYKQKEVMSENDDNTTEGGEIEHFES